MKTAIIDYLGLTIRTHPDLLRETAEKLLKQWLGVECRLIETGKGWNGYKCRLDIEGAGLVAFGGNGDTLHIELTGDGCVQVKSWDEVALCLEHLDGKITRVDVAADDMEGQGYDIDWCRNQYQEGGFDPERGAKPKAHFYGDEGSGSGCTYYVGSRETGKLFRGYEKGKEQGDPDSPWFRLEVEWRNRHREIPINVLRFPEQYFAAAYPCLADFSIEQRPIKTVAHSAAAHIEKAVEHAKKQAGRVLHALLTLNGGNLVEAAARLHVPELPKRLKGYITAFLALDESERTYTDATAPAWAHTATPDEVQTLHAAYRLPRAIWRAREGEQNDFEAGRKVDVTDLPAVQAFRDYWNRVSAAPIPALN